MIGSRAFFALMRRNLLYRRRYIISTLLEIGLPVAYIAILIAIKNSFEGSDSETKIIEPEFPEAREAFVPLSFLDFVKINQAKKVCDGDENNPSISVMPQQGFDTQNPFAKCDETKCEGKEAGFDASEFCEYTFLGVAPADPDDALAVGRAEDFQAWLFDAYPQLTNISSFPFDFPMVQLFKSEADMETYVSDPNYGLNIDYPRMSLGVVWESIETSEEIPAEFNYKYTLRHNQTNYNIPREARAVGATTTPDTQVLFDNFANTDDECPFEDGAAPNLGLRQYSCTGQYLYNGVLTLQKTIGDFILDHSGATTANPNFRVAENGVRFVPFPTREYEEGGFFSDVAAFLPLLVTLGILYPVASIISYIVKEKELRQKELLKMMSVAESDIGQSWFFSFVYQYILVAFFMALVTGVLYENSSFLLFFFFWIWVFIALIAFSTAIAAISSKTTRTVLIGLLLVFAGVFLTAAVDYKTGDISTISLVALHPISAFEFGILEVGRLEDAGVGLTMDTLDATSNPSGYSFRSALGNLIFDSIFWSFMTWYLNRVVKPDFGHAEPFYFLFLPSYWCGSSDTGASTGELLEKTDEAMNEGIPIEGVSNNLRENVQNNIVIRDLHRQFGEKTAVDGLSLTMYNGQVTALLGHNGAGKTTTISMLTGALEPTSGGASVLGNDLQTQLPEIRDDLGICLQHDCLFPKMTVREHIQFFSRLKGLYSKMSYAEAEENCDQIIKDVALFEKRNTYSANLSGGMKRKLSVAMAFCGGSKVVLLDEPTSGMDPFSRRFTWNVIRQFRQNRCILLTTHFMDEADVLGDRIAIMAEGQLRCVGSPLFLKKHYGVGYQLTVEKHHDFVGTASSKQLEELDSSIATLVEGNIKDASLLNNVGSEISYQLPVGEAGNFPKMFNGLEEKVQKGFISSYGVGITTLEEVFLLVARGGEAQQKVHHYKSSRSTGGNMLENLDDSTASVRSRMNYDKDDLFTTHVRALLVKRAANFRRDKKAWCCTSILPSLFVTLGLVIFRFAASDPEFKPLTLSLDDYNADISEPDIRNPVSVNSVSNKFQCQPGFCGYQYGNFIFEGDETSEPFTICGLQAVVNPDQTTTLDCTLDEGTPFMQNVVEFGAETVELNATGIFEASEELFEQSTAYKATQYGAIYYTHDETSVLDDGVLFRDAVLTNCTRATFGLETLGDTLNTYDECDRYTGLAYLIQYNFTAPHISPTYMTVATEGIAREALQRDFKIEATLHSLPLSNLETKAAEQQDVFLAWFLLVLSFPFIAGSFGTFVVAERESKAKHLQTVTGVKPSGYWVSTYLWDVVNYQIPLWIVVALFFIFGVDAFTTTDYDALWGVLSALFLFGPAAAGFTYCVSYAFTSPALCNVIIIVFGFLAGMGGTIAVVILNILGESPFDPKPQLVNIATIITWIMRFHPCFNLGHAVYYSVSIELFIFFYPDATSVFDSELILWDIVFLAWQSVAYLLLAIQIDIWSTNPHIVSYWKSFVYLLTCSRPRSPDRDITRALAEDSDVLAEEERVNLGNANGDVIVIDKLTKVYDNGKKAVNSMSLGIPPGQVFGLLGVNGAGKTTTMQMLTAEFPATSGDATLAGFSVSKEPEKTRRRVGYCPQFDAHFANMTGREHVELYATIKGIPFEHVKEVAARKLEQVGLSEFDSDRLSVNYSGGMKRRLSLACATIGDPQIVFLDECSTGVDPVARREIWELVSEMVSSKSVAPEERTSVILTTHSMEECEALCPRIGIMANGRLRALGSAQQLKNKFGRGYQVELKCKFVDTADSDYVEIEAALRERRAMSTSAGPSAEEKAEVPTRVGGKPDFVAVNTSDLQISNGGPAETAEPAPASRPSFKGSISVVKMKDAETGQGEASTLDAQNMGGSNMGGQSDQFFNLEQTIAALQTLTGDQYLSYVINDTNPIGYGIHKSATSETGVSLDELAAFATVELRIRKIAEYIVNAYSSTTFRERQDTKVRYEVSSEGVKISDIFTNLEERKEELMLDDYGVSQTSLEQVFNMHAAEAEKLKHGMTDG